MKKYLLLLFVPLVVGFSGCSTAPTTPVFSLAAAQRDVFAAKEAYGVAEKVATVYASLKRCAVPAVQPCSDAAVVAQITKARNIARDSLAAAQGAVDNPIFGSDAISTAVIAAQSGLKAFESISNQGAK